MSSESGLHYYSKTVLASWLRQLNGRTKNFKGLNNINFKCKTTKKLIGLDETWDQFATRTTFKAKSKNGIPTKYELKNNNSLTTLYIFDIVVLDGSKLAYVFEIKHTHAVDDKKIKFVEKYSIPTYEVSAQWVLERIIGKIPFDLQFIASYGPAVKQSPQTVSPQNVNSLDNAPETNTKISP